MSLINELTLDTISARCAKLQAPSYVNLALSVVILLGILISYLPQHYRIIHRGSSEGISPFFILLGATSSTSGFATILVLPASRADVACCKSVSTFECVAGMLGIAQLAVQWSCFILILMLYLIFFPRSPSLPTSVENKPHSMRTAVSVGILCVVHGLLVIFISVALAFGRPAALGAWANFTGIMGTVLSAIQYMPQIWMTYHLGQVGSLSIPMMLIQTPGSFVWGGSLAARFGIEGWSTWGIMFVTGICQGCLLFMGLWFELKARRAELANPVAEPSNGTCIVGYIQGRGHTDLETDDEGNAFVASPSERSPLVRKTRRTSRPAAQK